jgi:hypothetical protein
LFTGGRRKLIDSSSQRTLGEGLGHGMLINQPLAGLVRAWQVPHVDHEV